ncbi:MAG: ABC transporter permease [Pseudobdellovibrionaceae bacterium]
MSHITPKIINVLCLGFIAFLILPYLFLISEFSASAQMNWPEFWWVCKNTLIQSFLSALTGTALGFMVALGLCKIQTEKFKKILTALCFIPFYVPTLFFVLAVLQVWKDFPMGLWGVVVIHVLMNFGMSAIIIYEGISHKAGSSVDLAMILGAGKWKVLSRILIPLIRFDLFVSFSVLFIYSFLSFSVPMLVGGQQVSSFEVMIYEIIRYESDWSGAVFISVLQSLFLGSLFYFTLRPPSQEKKNQINNSHWIGIPYLWCIVLLPVGILLLGYSVSFFQSQFLFQLKQIQSLELFEPILHSVSLGLSSAVAAFAMSCLATYLYFSTVLAKFVRFFLGPTSALVGFGVLIWGNRFHLPETAQLITAYLLIFHLYFLRNVIFPRLAEIQRQYELSKILSASEFQFFKKVAFKSISSSLFQSSALLAVWVMGDFVISNMISKHHVSLAQVIQRLANQYRLDQAMILSAGLGILIFMVYSGIQRLGHVVHQTTHKDL